MRAAIRGAARVCNRRHEQEGAIVSTDDTLYFGFGLEGVATREERADLLGRSLGYLSGAHPRHD